MKCDIGTGLNDNNCDAKTETNLSDGLVSKTRSKGLR